MSGSFKKVLIWPVIAGGIAFFVWKGLNSLDAKQKEKMEAQKNLNEGTCVFDKVNMDQLTITNNGKKYQPIEKTASFKRLYSDELVNVSFGDTLIEPKTIQVDNNDLGFCVVEPNIYVNYVIMDHNSDFTFETPDGLKLSANMALGDISEKYPNSAKCKDVISSSRYTENYALRIDNSGEHSHLKYIILYFDPADRLNRLDFGYEGFNP